MALVTVAIAAFNAGQYLEAAVESVLRQSFEDLECIIVDDGSVDGSVSAVRRSVDDSRLRVFHQSNSGKSVALNRALRLATGDFFCIMDADDVSCTVRVERLVEGFRATDGLCGLMSGYDLIIGSRRLAPISNEKDERACKADIDAFRMPSHDPTLMVRTEVARKLKFSDALRVGQGYDLILRLGEKYPLRVLADVLYSYRLYPTSSTRANIVGRLRSKNDVARLACVRRGIDPDALFPDLEWENHVRENKHRENGLNHLFIDSVRSQRKRGQLLSAIYAGYRCAVLHPFDPAYYKALVYALMPVKLAESLRPVARA
jgi:glycosyltransferase involved in cell wall biosynthesis